MHCLIANSLHSDPLFFLRNFLFAHFQHVSNKSTDTYYALEEMPYKVDFAKNIRKKRKDRNHKATMRQEKKACDYSCACNAIYKRVAELF